MKDSFESKGLKVDFGKTKVMVNGGNTRTACLNAKLIYVGTEAREQRLIQFCVYSVVSGSTVDVPEKKS